MQLTCAKTVTSLEIAGMEISPHVTNVIRLNNLGDCRKKTIPQLHSSQINIGKQVPED